MYGGSDTGSVMPQAADTRLGTGRSPLRNVVGAAGRPWASRIYTSTQSASESRGSRSDGPQSPPAAKHAPDLVVDAEHHVAHHERQELVEEAIEVSQVRLRHDVLSWCCAEPFISRRIKSNQVEWMVASYERASLRHAQDGARRTSPRYRAMADPT